LVIDIMDLINAWKIEHIKEKIYLLLPGGNASTFPQPPSPEPKRLSYTRN